MSTELQIWLALIGPAVVVLIAIVGALRKLLSSVAARFLALDEKLDAQTSELKREVTELYVRHEDRDQARHVENVQRLTRLETLVKASPSSTWPGLSH